MPLRLALSLLLAAGALLAAAEPTGAEPELTEAPPNFDERAFAEGSHRLITRHLRNLKTPKVLQEWDDGLVGLLRGRQAPPAPGPGGGTRRALQIGEIDNNDAALFGDAPRSTIPSGSSSAAVAVAALQATEIGICRATDGVVQPFSAAAACGSAGHQWTAGTGGVGGTTGGACADPRATAASRSGGGLCAYDCQELQAHYFPGQSSRCFIYDVATQRWPEELLGDTSEFYSSLHNWYVHLAPNAAATALELTIGDGRTCTNVSATTRRNTASNCCVRAHQLMQGAGGAGGGGSASEAIA